VNASAHERFHHWLRARSVGVWEGAFTLIELIVAMVVMAIVISMIGTIVMSALRGSTDTRSGAVADATVQRATLMFTSDLSAAITEDRAQSKLRQPRVLREAVVNGTLVQSSDPADGGRIADIDDVRMATSREVQLIADVAPVKGSECVTWRSRADAGRAVLERLIDPAASCGNGALGHEIVMSSPLLPNAAESASLDIFSYHMMCASDVCSASPAPADNVCESWIVHGAVAQKQLRWVVAVEVSIQSIIDEHRSAARSSAHLTGEITSRRAPTYRAALGC